MSIRETILGKRDGQTAFEKLKDGWHKSKSQQEWEKKFRKSYNPLNLTMGEIFELGAIDPKPFKVSGLYWYETPQHQPDYSRYQLSPLDSEQEPCLLEVMPDGPQKILIYSKFSLIDEFELDEKLLHIIEEEDTLDHTRPSKDGNSVDITFDKDFSTQATLHYFQDLNYKTDEIYCVNYFTEIDQNQELFLTVEISESNQWMSFFEGEKIRSIEVSGNLI